MRVPSTGFLVHGTDATSAPPQRLRAGPLTLDYDNGDLRGVKLGECEVIRRIYGAVRDRNWGAVPGVISNLHVESSKAAFRIHYVCEHRQGNIHFVWRAELIGDADGTLQFSFDGRAETTFLRNRVGLCVLHPIRECAGARARALLTDGSERELRFPESIAAEQPIRGFEGLAALAHEVAPGIWAEARFTGEVFETEDQRNWIDASFKTYGTSLSVPFPVEVKAQTGIRQSVELRLVDKGTSRRVRPEAGAHVGQSTTDGARHTTVRVDMSANALVPLPGIGLAVGSRHRPLTDVELGRLAALNVSHLRADVKLAGPDWRARLSREARLARALGLPLELAVHLPSNGNAAALTELRRELTRLRVGLSRVFAFQDDQQATTAPVLALMRERLGDLAAPIGAGTTADLYQMNQRRPPSDADFICWTMNPQVHAGDTRSLMETPEAAAAQIASVRTYFPGLPLVVSPITLKPRFNAAATDAEATVPPDDLRPEVDPRQMSLVGAAWSVAMFAALAPAGVESLTFFETTGRRGVMETTQGSPLADTRASFTGCVFPMWHVFAALNGYRSVSAVIISEPRLVAAFAVSATADRRRIVLANLTPGTVAVSIAAVDSTVRLLDESSVADAMTMPETWWRLSASPLKSTEALPAYAVAFVDVAPRGLSA